MPTQSPTSMPTRLPTQSPTRSPTYRPTIKPTRRFWVGNQHRGGVISLASASLGLRQFIDMPVDDDAKSLADIWQFVGDILWSDSDMMPPVTTSTSIEIVSFCWVQIIMRFEFGVRAR
jgi:hypothetical protein